MKKFENILWILVLVCLISLTLMSLLVWNNMFTTLLFTAGIFIWLFSLEAEFNK